MAKLWLLIVVFIISTIDLVRADTERQIYIVYMGAKAKEILSVKSYHLSILEQVLEDSSPEKSLIYSYGKSFNGFAAWLTDKEQEKIIGMTNIVSVFRSKKYQLHTTRSWDFLGFPIAVNRLPKIESNIIIGIIDTGIWPESLSFRDDGMGPPPSKWKGTCQDITCNNKIIGARVYITEYMVEKSPRDVFGHGTHVASIIAGREVNNVSFLGIAKGIVRGAVPTARIAVYKVFDGILQQQDEHNILAAFDDAIADGVDVISLSLGSAERKNFFEDAIAIGAFHAMQNGIFVSCAALNFGPQLGTVGNAAPWALTVAANTIDRKFVSNITLGNGVNLEGLAVNAFPTDEIFTPLTNDQYNKKEMKGKIVLFDRGFNEDDLSEAGAHGVTILTKIPQDQAMTFPLPTTVISNGDVITLKSYVFHTRYPKAIIHQSVSAYDSKAPTVASFSSRGPHIFAPLVLKPDISAPGVDILAAYSPKGKVSQPSYDKRSVTYYIASGTSMACPHATGAATYVKTFHPTWSPASIKSALMTTASPMKTIDQMQGEFAYGAGQIDPIKALNPGLVFDTLESDYMEMLCNLKYSNEQIRMISGKNIMCGKVKGDESSLNYPSMTSYVNSKQPFTKYFLRKVTNVGSPNSIYKAKISPQSLVNITVTPNTLSFKSLNEKLGFSVNIYGGVFIKNQVVSASLTWSDGVHNVRSPIVVLINVQ